MEKPADQTVTMTAEERRLRRFVKQLPQYQRDILHEAELLGKGALCLPMGSGKTLLGLVLGLRHSFRQGRPFLVVCAKNLVDSWRKEIQKHFGDMRLSFVSWLAAKDVRMIDGMTPHFVLTTPDTVAAIFKQEALEPLFVEKEQVRDDEYQQLRHEQLRFHHLDAPLLQEPRRNRPASVMFAHEWSCVVVDEAHQYLNIRTLRTQALCSLWAPSQWLLSGTLFDEPKAERLMGFLYLLHDARCPETLADMRQKCKQTDERSGVLIKPHCVVRKDNLMWSDRPPLEEVIVTSPMTADEMMIYQQLKQAIKQLTQRIVAARQAGLAVKPLSASLMSMMTYLRMCLVVPLSLMSNLLIRCIEQDYAEEDETREVMRDICLGLRRQLQGRVDMSGGFCSTRVSRVVELVAQHAGERVVIFSAFQCLLNVVQHFLERDVPGRRLLRLTGDMTSDKRGEVVRQLEQSDDGVAMMTFQLGGTGLNLQCATVCIVMDFWWNSGMTRQALSRIMRFGQRNKVTSYLLTSNTSFELELFRLHQSKKERCEQIMEQEEVQGLERARCTLSFDKITQLVNMQESVEQLQRVL